MIIFNKAIAVMAAVTMAMCLTACGGKDNAKLPVLSGQEAVDTFASSQSVYLTGDLNDVNTFSDVNADGYICGEVKETGIFNPGIVYEVDGEEKFHIEYYTGDEFDDCGYVTATAYVYYDNDNNVIGYAQERIVDEPVPHEFVMTFMDADKNMKGYYVYADDGFNDWADADTISVVNPNFEQVGTINIGLTSIISRSIAISMDLGEAAEELSEMDRVLIYWKSIFELNSKYDL